MFELFSYRRDREFKVTIKLANKPDLYQLQQFLRSRQHESPQETIQVLDVVLRTAPSQKYCLCLLKLHICCPCMYVLVSSNNNVYKSDSYNYVSFYHRYCVVGRSFFDPNLGPQGDLGDGLEYWRGFYQSLRPTQFGLSLNIGTSHNFSSLSTM